MLVVRLTTKLDLICTPKNLLPESESETLDVEPSAAYAHSILRTLADVVGTKVDKGHPDVPKYIDRLLPKLYHLHIYSAVAIEEALAIATDARLVAVSAEIVTKVVQTQTAAYVVPPALRTEDTDILSHCRRQETFVADLFAAFYENQVKRVADGQPKIPDDRLLKPFEV